MKKKLEKLKVESFITSLSDDEKRTVDGGVTTAPCLTASIVVSMSAASVYLITYFACTWNTCNPLDTPCPIPDTYVCQTSPYRCPPA